MRLTEEKERLISRYLNGDCNGEEEEELLRWVYHSKKNRTHFMRIKDVWDASLLKEDGGERELFHFYKMQFEKSSLFRKNIRIWQFVAGFAALVVLGFVISLFIQVSDTPENQFLKYKVPLGSRTQLFLADGTEVHLNSGSQLEFSSDFTADNRIVRLSGEAYFNIPPGKSHPFVVKTADFDITVKGTRFNVCSYSDSRFATASLLEGKIRMSGSRVQSFEMNPGEKVVLDKRDKKLTQVALDAEAEIAWKEGQFVFKNIALIELIKRLERWYDVKLNYANNELCTLVYSGSFKNQETIWQVLDALRLTSPIDYKREGFREFTIIYNPEE